MGGGVATDRDGRVVPAQPFDDRVVRDGRFKLWIGLDREPTALYDLRDDPWEERDLLGSGDPEAVAALGRLRAVAASFPDRDAAPRYRPNPPRAWDRVPPGSTNRPSR